MTEKDDNLIPEELYSGLQALSNLSFPKICSTCGARYESVEDFVSKTDAPRKSTGLKQEWDDDDEVIVNLFRNCSCGSTLMDEFKDRRDLSEGGLKRRAKFDELLIRLEKAGFSNEVAREELLKVMRGQGSKLLKVKKDSRKTGRVFTLK